MLRVSCLPREKIAHLNGPGHRIAPPACFQMTERRIYPCQRTFVTMSLLPSKDTAYDVCVVGAGISGLRSALVLARAGYSVMVLEARSRVGGRTLTHSYKGGGTFDLGGQWLGPTQTRMNALVTELGLETIAQEWFVFLEASSAEPIIRSGAEKLFDSNAKAELARVVEKMTECMGALSRDHDRQTVLAFVKSVTDNQLIINEIDMFVCNSLACTSEDVSLYTFLHFVKACGGFHVIGDGKKGAQNHTVLGGAQRVSIELARHLRDHLRCDISLGSPVTSITTGTDGIVSVRSTSRTVLAKRVIVALAPTLWKGRITFTPQLSAEKQNLRDTMTSGRVIKVVCIYRDVFWEVNRQGDGEKTQGDLSAGPVRNLFPTRVGPFPALLGLITAKNADDLKDKPTDAIKEAVIHQLRSVFPDQPAVDDIIDFYCIDWTTEQFSGGCFEALAPLGMGETLIKHGWTRENKIHFTCAEFGTSWPGYMEGAIESADRVAEEVQRELGLARWGVPLK